MSPLDLLQVFIFIFFLVALIPPMGLFMEKVFEGHKTFLHPILGWLENLSYAIGGIDNTKEMDWRKYAKALLLFNFIGFFTLFILQMTQQFLPLNPQHFPDVNWTLAFNTAASFATNTNWQAYAGETTLSYLTQMLGLTVQNFLSAASGICVLLTLIRGIKRKTTGTIGNFWTDLVRTTIYIFLPLSVVMSIILVSQGVIQTFSPYVEVTTMEGAQQIIPLGPVASQVAIKQLGTNGGGFFNTNSAHPFENPTALTNFLETFFLIWIPAALVYMYGILLGNKRQAWLLLGVMFFIWLGGLAISYVSESLRNPIFDAYPSYEGIETRFGPINSLLWSTFTTATANGSVNVMLSSLPPLAGGIALANIMMEEVIFGGVGVGLCSMFMFVLLTVFLSGLMVGRTPEYMGKKIEKHEIQWVIVAILVPSALILIGAGISSILPSALSSLSSQGPHGLTELLYAYSSAAGNNGSSFAGLNANTDYFNLTLGITMLLARLSIFIPSLVIAGSLCAKRISPPSPGTFSTNTLLFAILLFSTIIFVGALTFFPALSLGPIIEHLLMLRGRTF